MEYAKDEIFNIHYNSRAGTIDFGTSHKKGFKKFLKRNKWISVFTILGIAFSIVNIVLIIKFFNILSRL